MKKVISFVLVLALVLGSFSMAFALTDVEGDANEAAINVVNDLGIVTGYTDGTFQPEKAVTRAEFAAMITRALNIPESALAGYTATTFKDTTGYGWAVKYLAFCNDKGIMLGDGAGNAMPGRTINMNEAVTMALRAIGLTDNSALLVGSWPANYVTVAKSVDLYTDVDAVTTVDRATAAQIIYNLLTVEDFVVNADGLTTSTGTTLMAALADEDESGKEIVTYESDSLIALAPYIGAYGMVYRNADGEIIAVDPETVFITGDYEDGVFTTTDDVEYKVSTAAITTAALTITNGDEASGVTLGTDQTLAVKISGKTIKAVYSEVVWDADQADLAPEDVQDVLAEDKTLLDEAFYVDDNDEINTATFELLGAKSLADIEEDDVVYVYTNDEDYIVKVVVGTETVTGQVTKYDTKNAVWTIAGEKLAVTEAVGVTPSIADLDVENKGTARLDYYGDIFAWELEEAAQGDYAVLIATGTSIGTTTMDSSDYVAKLYTNAGEEKVYVVEATADAFTLAATADVLVEFTLNDDGEIDTITKAAADAPVVGAPNEAGTLIGTQKVSKNVLVFTKDEDGDYAIGKMADLGETVTVEAVMNDDNIVVALFAGADDLVGADDNSYGLVIAYGNSILNADGDKVTVADIIMDGVAKEDVESANVAAAVVTDAATALRDIVVDADGKIKTAAAVVTSATITSAEFTTVEAIDGTLVTVDVDNTYDVAADAVVYIYDISDDEWSVGKLSGIKKATTGIFWNTDADDNDLIDVILVHVE